MRSNQVLRPAKPPGGTRHATGVPRQRMYLTCLAVMLLLSAVGLYPSTASASLEFEAEGETYPVKIEVEGTQTITLESEGSSAKTLTITCNITAKSELTEAKESLSFTPSYSGCKAKSSEGSESSATVSPGTCGFETKIVDEEKEVGEGSTSIEPSGCGPIKVEVPAESCTVEFGSQGPFSDTKFYDESEGGIETTESVANIEISKDKCEIGCPHMKIKADLDIQKMFKGLKYVWESATGKLSVSPAKAELQFKAIGEKKKFAIENRIGADLKAESAAVTGPNKAAFNEVANLCGNKLYTALVGKCEPEIELTKVTKPAPFEIKQKNGKTVTLTLKGFPKVVPSTNKPAKIEKNVGEEAFIKITYENQGPGEWEPNSNYNWTTEKGGENPFSAVKGTCTKNIPEVAPNNTCETEFKFKPAKKEEFQASVVAEFGAEKITFTGKGL